MPLVGQTPWRLVSDRCSRPPWPSTQARPKACGMTPQIVAASPAWKPLTVLQMSAVGPRSSTKNVSVPLPPVRKFEPVPPSKTLMPLLTAIASFPLPLLNEPIGGADADIQAVRGNVHILLPQIGHRTRVCLSSRGYGLACGRVQDGEPRSGRVIPLHPCFNLIIGRRSNLCKEPCATGSVRSTGDNRYYVGIAPWPSVTQTGPPLDPSPIEVPSKRV